MSRLLATSHRFIKFNSLLRYKSSTSTPHQATTSELQQKLKTLQTTIHEQQKKISQLTSEINDLTYLVNYNERTKPQMPGHHSYGFSR